MCIRDSHQHWKTLPSASECQNCSQSEKAWRIVEPDFFMLHVNDRNFSEHEVVYGRFFNIHLILLAPFPLPQSTFGRKSIRKWRRVMRMVTTSPSKQDTLSYKTNVTPPINKRRAKSEFIFFCIAVVQVKLITLFLIFHRPLFERIGSFSAIEFHSIASFWNCLSVSVMLMFPSTSNWSSVIIFCPCPKRKSITRYWVTFM